MAGFHVLGVSHIPDPEYDKGLWWINCTGCRYTNGPYENRDEAFLGWCDHAVDYPDARKLEERNDGSVQVVVGYVITRPTDFSEGRSFARDVTLWVNEQDAWDQVNHLPGVQGAHPSKWGRREGRFDTWQAAKAAGAWTDYSVSPVHAIVRPAPTPTEG